MQVNYDAEFGILDIIAETPEVTAASLLDDPDVVVGLATEDGYDIASITIMGVPAYLPLGKMGYDTETDTLLLGRMTDDQELFTENGDLSAYWQVDEDDPDGFRHPIGVAVKNASVHLAEVMAAPSGV